jgi:hypothetical protein
MSRRGRLLGTEMQLNGFTSGPHREPRVASDSAGNFVVTWGQGEDYDYYFGYGPGTGPRCGSGEYVCQDGSGAGIIARAFDAKGVPVEDDQVLSGYHDHIAPPVGLNNAGRFVVAWSEVDCPSAENYYCRYSYGADGSGDGVEGATGLAPY